MSIPRVLFLSALAAHAACGSPTEPTQPRTIGAPPAASLPGGHAQQFGPPCGTTGPKVLCSGRN